MKAEINQDAATWFCNSGGISQNNMDANGAAELFTLEWKVLGFYTNHNK